MESHFDSDGKKVGSARVWLRDGSCPGLAMSRSFGDRIAKTVGVTSKPEILEVSLS